MMSEWTLLLEAGHEIDRAFDLLNRSETVVAATTATVLTKTALIAAARDAVDRANMLLVRRD